MATGPIIDGRDRAEIFADLLARVPGYVPEWSRVDATPAYALMSILARDVEIQAAAENGMPGRSRLAFLSALGNSLLSAQAAGTPLLFQLMPNAPLDVTLNGGSQIAAKLPPPPPSLLGPPAAPPAAPLFSTDETITLTRAQLSTVYSVDPNADTYADHSAALTTGFAFFDAMQPVPHQLYLGHDEMFRLPGQAEIQLSFDLAASYALTTPRPLLLDWEYLSADGWLPLRIGDDQTARLTKDGRVILWLDCGPDAKQDTIAGVSSYWIRATVSARIPSGKIGPLPGGYALTWQASPTLTLHRAVTVDGTTSAQIVAVSLSTITLDRGLPGARSGAALLDAATSSFVGRIIRTAGQVLVLAGVDPGRSITVAGSNGTAIVLDASGAVAMLDQLLTGGAVTPGAVLLDAETGEPVGTLRILDPDFSVPLDSGAEFLVGDLVTVDGSTQAVVKAAQAESVTLQAPIQNTTLGNQLVLANALPVLRPEGADASGVLPSLDTVFARVGFTKSDLTPDAAYCDSAPLDTSNAFYPFGKQPQKFTTFYIASEEVFQRQNAQVVMTFLLAQAGNGFDDNDNPGVGPNALDVSIEYFNGDAWTAMGPAQSLLDQTNSLTVGDRTHPTTISFICPANWQATKVNGQTKHWLRMRIDGGNYGHPLRLSVDTSSGAPVVVSDPSTLQPPVIASLRLQYTFLTNAGLVQHCLSYNDFAFTDHSEDVQWPRRTFQPFTPVGDTQPSIRFGFSQQLPSGLVSLYYAADPEAGAPPPPSSPFVWEYASARGWVGLSVLDQTDGFSGSGFVQFIGPSDANAVAGLGGSLYWIRARLKPDIPPTPLPADGLWINAVEAHQGTSVQNDTLGSSDGNPGQTFAFAPQHVPVLPNEVIQVREWTGRGDDWQTAVLGVPSSDLHFDYDPTDGKTVIAVWVTWHLVPYFYSSGPNDRSYMLERATGLLQFPTPPYGMIPPAGALITASCSTGGGLDGNVPANTISELHSGASYVRSVTNPFAASGGSATEDAAPAQDRATQHIRNRGRAVAPADFEWIAREASPQVARARCLATTGPDGARQLGWVTLVVVPNSTDAAPMPSTGLLAEVKAALTTSVPAAIAGSILLAAPSYTAVSVRADIVPLHADQAAMVEARVRDRLATFLHPLIGGADGTGWDFGQFVYQSQIATVLEATEGVDYVSLLQLLVNEGVVGDFATIAPDSLVTQGDHQLKLLVEEG